MNLNVDLTNVEPIDVYQPLPAGAYNVEISNAEQVTSKAGNPCLTIELVVLDGEFKDRKLFECFVLNKPVGLGRLKKLLIASKKVNPDKIAGVSEIIGLKLTVNLVIEKDTTYGHKNKIVRFLESSGSCGETKQISQKSTPIKMPYD